jgi:hypothetical protein
MKVGDIQGTNTCLFVELNNIPKDRTITYGKIVCDYNPHKKEKECVRITVGGDRLDYSGDVATYYIQNADQQHTVNKIRCIEDDGH